MQQTNKKLKNNYINHRYYTECVIPRLGTVLLSIDIDDNNILRNLSFVPDTQKQHAHIVSNFSPAAEKVKQQINEYFSGKRRTFTIPYEVSGTDFQRNVWKQISIIQYGKTTSYSSIAQLLHNPRASRAVGNAVAHNPITIIIPCHRVRYNDKRIDNYAVHSLGVAKGQAMKQFLLTMETEQ